MVRYFISPPRREKNKKKCQRFAFQLSQCMVIKGQKVRNDMKKSNVLDFHDLYKQYFHHIYRFAYSLMGHPEEANDITQETFIKLYRQIESGEEIRTPKAWIYRVAGNSCYNHLKREKLSRDIMEKETLQTDISPENIEEDLAKKQEI